MRFGGDGVLVVFFYVLVEFVLLCTRDSRFGGKMAIFFKWQFF